MWKVDAIKHYCCRLKINEQPAINNDTLLFRVDNPVVDQVCPAGGRRASDNAFLKHDLERPADDKLQLMLIARESVKRENKDPPERISSFGVPGQSGKREIGGMETY